MKNLKSARNNPVYRTGAFLLSLVLISAAFWSFVITASKWDDLWTGGDYYNSSTAREDASYGRSLIRELMELKQKETWNGSLSYLDRERERALEEALAPDKTNFRYQVHDQTGSLLSSNLGGATLDDITGFQQTGTFNLFSGQLLHEEDEIDYDEEADSYSLRVMTESGPLLCDPAESEGRYNQYGWYSNGYRFYDYAREYDSRIKAQELVFQYGIARPMSAEDEYAASLRSYQDLQRWLPGAAAAALVLCLLSLISIVFLCSAAGRREDGIVTSGWQERVPYDVYLFADGLLWTVLLSAGDSITYAFNQNSSRPAVLVGLGVFTLLGSTLALGLILTTAVRIKLRILWRTSLIGRFCGSIGRACVRTAQNWPITKRTVIFFLLYLLGTFLTTITIVLIPVFQGFVLWLLCRRARQWRAIREGTARIVGGDPDFKIDPTGMSKDYREHAGQLNDLSSAIGSAVDERMKSERFKAELITNVSHDLKTPLTSIINYVDLLKKVPIENPQATEYIEVLDRKSQRLKKLTEDLVDASKASTGNLSVNLERLGMGQLVCQALGEYEEKFEQKRLEVVFPPPADELYIWADGRHLWRVVDNLFSNCAKYALEGTRIYLDLRRWEGNVFLSVKNISRQALNVPPEQLMERFVRGEESRTTEGSGLGLSIARSLTELQGGTFRLDIDGDLFKATVSFPEAFALTEAAPGESENQSA